MRSGDSLRDFYYQSPYLRRFNTAILTPLSNDKYSTNKENISPLSSQNMWLSRNLQLASGGRGGPSMSTNSSGNTISNTPQ